MKKVGKPMLFIVAAIIIGLTALSFLGFSTSYGDIQHKYIKGAEDIRWGIDIRGGVDVTFTPPDDYNATDAEMSAAESIIKVRLVSQNINDSEVYTDFNKNRIIVRFPWKENETDFNPEKAVEELGSTALLTFRENMDGPVILEGKHVESATAVQDQQGTNFSVSLKLNKEGAEKFAEATGRLIGQTISIWMDETVISSPTVNSVIPDGQAQITGGFTVEEVNALANKINGGALPFKLQTENFSSISPTLGLGARDVMVQAGVIAFILVSIFMILRYRMSGMVAVVALVGQIGGLIACSTGFLSTIPSFTLTLPGIAGIILSIGMGVDANVITSERVREEIRNGKTVEGAVDCGFERTFDAIFDGNITVIIVAAILMGAFGPPNSFFGTLFSPFFRWFGTSATGAVYSFGFTLLVGVIFNFIMGVTASRLMLKSVIKFKSFRKPWLYGGEKE